jgi:hypothetical protein
MNGFIAFILSVSVGFGIRLPLTTFLMILSSSTACSASCGFSMVMDMLLMVCLVI